MDSRFDLLPSMMKEAIQGLQDLHNTPDSMAMPIVLGTANLAIQHRFDVESEKYSTKPTTLWLLTMSPTGSSKTTNFNEVSKGINQYVEEKMLSLKGERLRYAMDEKVFKSEMAKYEKALKDGNGNIMSLPSEPDPIETAMYIIEKATLNGILNILRNQSFAGLFSSEASEFFSGHSFQDSKKTQATELTGAFIKLWDGSRVERNTGINEDRLLLRNRRLSMLFLLQTETVQDVLNHARFSEQGFIHRILITQAQDYLKPIWDTSEEARKREQAIRSGFNRFNDHIYRLIKGPCDRRTDGFDRFELRPDVIRQSAEAKNLFVEYFNMTLDWHRNYLKTFAGFASRLHEHAIRIAATIAAFEESMIIEERHAAASLALMDYFCEQRLQLEFGVPDQNPTQTQGTQRLRDWIQQHDWSGSQNNLAQSGPLWYRKLGRDQRSRMLQDLVGDEFLICEEKIALNGKRSLEFQRSKPQLQVAK